MKTKTEKSIASKSSTTRKFFSQGGGDLFFSDSSTDTTEWSFFNAKPFSNGQPAVQPKLTISKPGDQYELEADAMADQVVQRLSIPEAIQTKPMATPAITPLVQGKCAACEEEEKLQQKEEEPKRLDDEVQLKSISESNAPPLEIQRKCAACEEEEAIVQQKGEDASIESSLAASKDSGSPLPETTRQQMESSFGADFSAIRVHNDSLAVQMSKDLNAEAFTHVNDIYFNSGKYDLESSDGKYLLAHELTHTLQQNVEKPAIQRTLLEDIINSHTSLGGYGDLDETRLGIALKNRLVQGEYALVNSVFDELGWMNQDDVAYEIISASLENELDVFAGDNTGKRLLNRLYDFLTSGNLTQDEQTQSDRILNAIARQINLDLFPEDLERIKIFPFRLPGITVLSDAPIIAERRSNGTIYVKMPVRVLGTDAFKDETRTLPTETFISGIEIPENEVIGIKLYDLGGPVVFKPALYLIRLSNETTTQVLTAMIEAAGIGLTLGAGEFVVLGAEATMAARAVLWADRAAFVLGTLSTIINEHRGWIISTFGDAGRDFVFYNSLVNAAVAIYGIGRMVYGLGQLLNNFRRAYTNWRNARRAVGDLDEAHESAIAQIQSHTDEFLENSENISRTRRTDAPELDVETPSVRSGADDIDESLPARGSGERTLSLEEIQAQFSEVSRRRPGRSIDMEIDGRRYIEEIGLEGHSWRLQENGRWCIFSVKRCLTDAEMEFLGLNIRERASARLSSDTDIVEPPILRQEIANGRTVNIYEPTGDVEYDIQLIRSGYILDLSDLPLNVTRRFPTRSLNPDFVPPSIRGSGNRMVPNLAGETNAQLAVRGRSPYLSNGDPVELHHARQNFFELEEQSLSFHQGSLDELEAHPFADDPAYISWRHSYAWFEGQLRTLGEIYDVLRPRYWRTRF